MMIICWILGLVLRVVGGVDVLMVIGGQFFNATSRHHQPLSSVEVIGPNDICQIASLPTPLYGMVAGRVGNKVLVCGGFYYQYRDACYEYLPAQAAWFESSVRLPNPSAFIASHNSEDEFYIAGGRNYKSGDGRSAEDWDYWDSLLKLENGNWIKVVDLPEPLSDACILTTDIGGVRRLWLIGGSNYPQRYKSDVYALDLDDTSKGWKKMADSPDPRMWQACAVTDIDGNQGILVAGGYYNGVSSMWLPLQDRYGNSLETFGRTGDQPKWEWLSSLTMNRKWMASVGRVGGNLAIVGGGDYGDRTIEMLSGRAFIRSKMEMADKREFAAGVTVPSNWFPQCRL